MCQVLSSNQFPLQAGIMHFFHSDIELAQMTLDQDYDS